jgi:hypothetical protein
MVCSLSPILLLERESRKIIKYVPDTGVAGAQRLLVNCEGALEEWLGLGKAALGLIQAG